MESSESGDGTKTRHESEEEVALLVRMDELTLDVLIRHEGFMKWRRRVATGNC